MKFLCGSCRTKYQISDEKVRGKILTIRCKRCGAKITVRESLAGDNDGAVVAPVAEEPKSNPASPKSSGSGALSQAFSQALVSTSTDDIPLENARPPEAFEWYTAIDGQQHGPFPFDQVIDQVRGGGLLARHYVWHEGMEHWKRVREVEGLSRHLDNARTPPPPPAADRIVEETAREVSKSAPVEAGTPPKEEQAAELSLDADDIFASVPRASQEELVKRESTRFFVQAAGVRGIKSLNRLGMALGAFAFLLLAGVVVAAATGAIVVEIPGLGNPFTGGEGPELLSGEADEDDSVKGLAERKRAEQRRVAVQRRRPSRAATPNADDAFELGGGYVDDGSEGPEGPRGGSYALPEDPSLEIDLSSGGGLKNLTVGTTALPEGATPEMPAPDRATLSEEAVQSVVRSRTKSMKICFEETLRGDDKVGGKIELAVTIEPNGSVSRATVSSPGFKGSRLGKCMTDKVKGWRFPSFEGEPSTVEIPFVLQRASY